MKPRLLLVVLALLALPLGLSSAQSATATVKAVAAAKSFLATLNERQRASAMIALDKNTRTRWSNLPTGAVPFERNGVKLGDLTAAQQQAALSLVAATLTPTGFQKVMNIVNADETLERASARGRPPGNRVRFGRAEYYVSILGTPSATDPWMIQFGGHHLAINVTVVGGQNVLTPSHTGAQPSIYTFNGQSIRPLGNENDKAFALINALDATQRKQATLAYQVKDVV